MRRMIHTYNEHVVRWKLDEQQRQEKLTDEEKRRLLDEFVIDDARQISWSRDLKLSVMRARPTNFTQHLIRPSLYRPFCTQHIYFDRVMNEEVYSLPSLFPNKGDHSENLLMCLPSPGGRTSFWCLATSLLPEVHLTAIDAEQCFPFYQYSDDGTERTENITDWALGLYREHYGAKVSKWDIFHYHYAVLHHPEYRQRYAANLRKSLPRVPLVAEAEAFRSLAKTGKRLGEIHVDYEGQAEYPLREIWKEGHKPDLRVERMRLSKEKSGISYNDTLVLEGIPAEAFDYRLGNRSALEWVIDQYQVSVDKASGIENDPNREDDPGYIISLVKKVVTVSLETQKIIRGFPKLEIATSD
jgi:predicted helicase